MGRFFQFLSQKIECFLDHNRKVLRGLKKFDIIQTLKYHSKIYANFPEILIYYTKPTLSMTKPRFAFRKFSTFFLQGFEYSRSGNPNRDALEETLASIETGGAFGIAFASGSATTATVLQSLGPNAHIISVNDVYGGTFRYMSKVAKVNQGLETTFVDLESADDETILAAFRENTKVNSLSRRKTAYMHLIRL